MLLPSRRVTFIADLHLGNHKKNGGPMEGGLNVRCRQGLGALDRAVQTSITIGAEALVILGDVFHVSDPSPPLLAATARILRQRRLKIFVIVGNHDQESTEPGDHALGVLGLPPNVEIVEEPRLVTLDACQLFLVPFQPGNARIWLPAACRGEFTALPTLLCTHVGIYDAEFPRHLADAQDAVPLELIREIQVQTKMVGTLAGNWHSRKFWRRDNVLQVGALGPTGFGNPGLDGYGTLAIWDSHHGLSWMEMPGPRFAVINGAEEAVEMINGAARSTKEGCQVYVSIRTPVANLARAQQWIAEQVRAGHCLWGEAIPDAHGAEQAAKRAAAAARSSSLLHEAVYAYAERMEVPDGVPREEVTAAALDFLKSAGSGAGGGSLQVRRITARNFMQFKDVAVDLPAKGLALITGNNGKGKSSLIEAVSFAGWGATLRGTPPWPQTADSGEVRVESDLAVAKRLMSKGRSRLDWSIRPDLDPAIYESTTKANNRIEDIIGEHDVWRRTHVFSSSDTATFANATDDKRKHLMEVILGLDVFDAAQKKCRAKLKEAKEALTGAAHQAELTKTRLAGQEAQVATARKALEGLAPPSDETATREEHERLKGELQQVEARRTALLQELEETRRAGTARTARADEMERRLANLKAACCPTCDQAIPQELRDSILGLITSERDEATREREAAAREADRITREGKEVGARRASLMEQVADAAVKLRTIRETAEHYRKAQQVISEAEKGVETIRGDMEAREQAVRAAQLQVAILRCVETLNVGVRANVLGEALAGIEAVANVALAHLLSADVTLALRVEEDKLEVDIKGMGDDRGYKALSGGQRRRVDVALLLGLAQVSCAAYGREPGTLFFDEAFDALDPQGVESLISLLAQMAEERAIVVISHNPDLIAGLPSAFSIQVQDDSTLIIQGR